ncbi:MAG TPA: hypothetical protein VH592_10545 [Gemmataceae bacterium]|jgi:transposase
MTDNIVTKSAVSVTEMAKMVGLSRARFYQLVRRGTFPVADQDTVTGRPCYFEEKQRQVLEVRRRNCGVDGRPLLFYSRRRDLGQTKAVPRPTKPKVKSNNYADVIHCLEQVKITMTSAQVETTLKELFPEGTDGIDLGSIVEAIIERRRRQNSSGSA